MKKVNTSVPLARHNNNMSVCFEKDILKQDVKPVLSQNKNP